MELERLHGLQFDGNDEIKKPKFRSRIKENFTVEELQQLYDICLSQKFADGNEKVDLIHYLLTPKGFQELGAGTNRYAMMKDNYVFKFSLDHYGFDDNNTEFDMAPKLLKYGASKTYETNGLVAVAECVNVLSLNQFRENKDQIRGILKWMAEDYLFADLGTIDKNFRNWGYNDEGQLVFLDYGYVFMRDELLLRCTECGGRIGYDSNFDKMRCDNCGEKFTIHDIKAMMEADDEDRKRMFAKKKKTKVMIAPGFDKEEKKEELESSFTINVG